MTDLCTNDAITLARLLRSREVSAREVVAAQGNTPANSEEF